MKTFGGDGDDLLTSVVFDGTHFIAAGSKIDSHYGRQGWVIKFDVDLNLLWEKTYGGKQDDSFSQIMSAGDRKFFLIGETKSYGKRDGGADVYLVQIDGEGMLKWQRTYDLGSNDIGTSIALLKDGRYVITAVSCTKNPGTLLQEGFASYIVIHQDGTIVKQIKFTEGKKNKFSKVKATSDGGAIIVGTTSMLDKFPSADVWILKLNENCELLWSKIIPSPKRYDGAFDVVQMGEDFIVVGYSQVHQNQQMNFDNFLIIVLDKNGNILDNREWGFQDNDDLYGIIRLDADTVVIVGFKNAVSWPLTKVPGNSDVYLMKMKYDRRNDGQKGVGIEK
ncbi:MAG: lipoprotein [Armatimonadota bacterium]|nr:MAG: lipoprotein [Armatimonadota bacterium]